MDEFTLILLAIVLIILVSSIIYMVHKKRGAKHQHRKQADKPANQRKNFRVRVELKNSIMEVLKVGSTEINEHDACEIIDISTGGVGVVSYCDLPLKQQVFIRVHFYLNNETFSINGRIVRKIERINKNSFLYGVQFLELSPREENRLLKEIVAIENERRKIAIK